MSETPQKPKPTTTVIDVPLDKVLPLLNDRKDRTTQAYWQHETALSNDVIAAGVRNPVKGYWTPQAAFQLVCGQTRVNASRRAGKTSIPAIPLEGEIDETRLLIEELTDNNMQEGFDILALGGIYIDLMRAKGWTPSELCANVPAAKPPKVTKALSVFENLIDELKARLQAGNIGPRLGYALSRLPKEKQAEAYQHVSAMKVEQAEAVISGALGGKQKPKEKTAKVRDGQTCMEYPFGMTWEQLKTLGTRLLKAAAIGEKSPGVSPALGLPGILKSI